MMHSRRRTLIALGLGLLLAACGQANGSSPAATPSPTATAEATTEPSASVSASHSASEEPTPEPSTDEGGFAIAPNPDADALFLTRAGCQDPDAGFRLEYPDGWFANDEAGDLGPCAWYGPEDFEIIDPDQVPAGVAITIEVVPEDVFGAEDSPDLEEGVVGETQNAIRVEEDGTYTYLVQLGPPGEGPTLVARTSQEMAGDYELNKAVLDRMIATMELIGSVG